MPKISDSVTLVADTGCPSFVIRMIGPRHFIIAGGGGSAKTGIPNRMQIFSLDLMNSADTLVATLVTTIETGSAACMNLDIFTASLVKPDKADARPAKQQHSSQNNAKVAGRDQMDFGCEPFLEMTIAAGLDQFCTIYVAKYDVVDVPIGKALGFAVKEVKTIETVSGKDSYQKAVRCGRDRQFFVTGGTDGQFRIWNLTGNLDSIGHKLLAHAASTVDLDAVDVSPDGKVVLTIARDNASLWKGSSRLADLPMQPQPLPHFKGESVKYRFRCGAFSPLGRRDAVFFTVSVCVNVRAKTPSFATQWALNETEGVRPLLTKRICIPAVCAMSVCPEPSMPLIAFGDAEGSVHVFNSVHLSALRIFREAHNSFVTAVEFLPSSAPFGSPVSAFHASHLCGVLSVSTDNTVQLHGVSFARLNKRSLLHLPLAICRVSCPVFFCVAVGLAFLSYRIWDFVLDP